MPFGPFAKKFSPKRPVPRRAQSLSSLTATLNRDALNRELNVNDKLDKIQLTLGGNRISFDGGEWISETGSSGVSQKELITIKKSNEKLKEENNLLKFKMEILLDMLTKATAEQNLQGKEIDDLKHMIRNKSGSRNRS